MSYDCIAIAGGVKDLPIEQIEVSIRLHQPKTIVLIQHEDCGAYGGSEKFENLESEKNFQKEELQRAVQALKSEFSDVLAERFFILLSGEIVPM